MCIYIAILGLTFDQRSNIFCVPQQTHTVTSVQTLFLQFMVIVKTLHLENTKSSQFTVRLTVHYYVVNMFWSQMHNLKLIIYSTVDICSFRECLSKDSHMCSLFKTIHPITSVNNSWSWSVAHSQGSHCEYLIIEIPAQ